MVERRESRGTSAPDDDTRPADSRARRRLSRQTRYNVRLWARRKTGIHRRRRPIRPRRPKGFNPWIAGAIVVAVVGVGALVLSSRTDEAATSQLGAAGRRGRPARGRPCGSRRQTRTAQARLAAADSIPGLRAAAPAGSDHRGLPVRRRASRDPELRSLLLRMRAHGHGGNHDCFVKQRARERRRRRVGRARRRVRRLHRRGERSPADVRVGRLGARHPRGDRQGVRGERSRCAHANAEAACNRRPRGALRRAGYETQVGSWTNAPRRSRGSSKPSTKACTSGRSAPNTTATIAANPHLKLIFGYASETPEDEVRPFDRESFVDPQARLALLERLTTDGAVADYLLRLRRADDTPVWVEAHRPRRSAGDDGSLRDRSAHPRRQRAQEAGRRDARHLSPAAAGREDGGARPDDFRRRPRTEQPARDDPQLGRAAVAEGDARSGRSAAASTPSSASPSAPRASSATC